MDLSEYLATIKSRWIVIVALAIIGLLVGYGYAKSLPRLYHSTSSVFVASQGGSTNSDLLQGSTFTQDQVQSFAQLADLPVVLDPVISELGLTTTPQKLAGEISANIRLNTVIIDITVSDRSPQQAAAIANAVTTSLDAAATKLSPQGKSSAIRMTTVAKAKVAASPYSPNTKLDAISGGLIGLILGLIYAVARELLDTRVRSEKDMLRVTDLPLLGRVARRRRMPAGSIVMRTTEHGHEAEDFRRIAANLEFADVDNPVRSIVVTSALPAEGKTTTAINLALAIAERAERVLVIDADLRKPSVADYCGIEGAVGLTSVLIGSATVAQAVRPWAGGVVDVLPSGTVPANPSQLIGSAAMASLLERLIGEYDFVVVDSPPLLPVTDTLTLGKLVDGVVVVVRSYVTRRHQLSRALGSLEFVSARVLGLILNGAKLERESSAYYSYQASSGSEDAVPAVGSDAASDSENVVTPDSNEEDGALETIAPKTIHRVSAASSNQVSAGQVASRFRSQEEVIPETEAGPVRGRSSDARLRGSDESDELDIDGDEVDESIDSTSIARIPRAGAKARKASR
jgi:capsular exopolysaccharide synthesis family protein